MLLSLRDLTLAFGADPVLDRVDLTIERGERIALLGRNGAGKSSLLKVIEGSLRPESGVRQQADGLRIARLEQTLPTAPGCSVRVVTAEGAGDTAQQLLAYERLSREAAERPDAATLRALEQTQKALEAADGWSLQQRIETVLSRLGLDPEAAFDALSGGLRRRVLLARALVSQPDLLLLDEPTNHLDVSSIELLETLLANVAGTVLFITHDRTFLRRMAGRILLLDRGRLFSYPGDYDRFLSVREQELAVEAQQNALFDKRLSEEERWIRQGIKARRTRNEGRVRALQAMRRERAQRREQQGRAGFQTQAAERSGKRVIEAEDLTLTVAGKPLVRSFSTTIQRGDKIGLIGPNGVGKTTLLRLLLGEQAPDSGRVHHGTRLEIAYFDQLRGHLDEQASVAENVAGGSETLQINGQTRHIHSYLRDFLFSPAQVRGPITALSGGERNRVVLARLFSQPANLLVLDEPTNDLDLETLELLEERLIEFPGTVLLVSHDRAFLDQVVTSCLVFSGDGRIEEVVGGYQDVLREQAAVSPPAVPAVDREATPKTRPRPPAGGATPKLRYREQQELDALPERLAALEAEQTALAGELAQPELYRRAPERVREATQRLADIEQQLEAAMERWLELEDRAAGG